MPDSAPTENKINPDMETGPRIVPRRVMLEDKEKETGKIKEQPEKEKEKESDDSYEENFKESEAELDRYVAGRHKIASDLFEIKKVLGKNLKSGPEDIPDIEHSRSRFEKTVEKLNRKDSFQEKYLKICGGVKLFDLKTNMKIGLLRDPESMAEKIDKFIDWHRAQMEERELSADAPESKKKLSSIPAWKKEYKESIANRPGIKSNFKDLSEALYSMALAQRCASLGRERKSLEQIKDPNEHARGRLAEVDRTIEEIKKELLEKKSPAEKVDKVVDEVYGKYGEEFDKLDMAEQRRKIRGELIESPGSEEIIIFVDIFSKMARDFFKDDEEIKKLSDLKNYGASDYLKDNKKSEIGKIYGKVSFLFRGKGEIKPKKDENMSKWLNRVLPKVIEARRVTSL